MQSDRIPDSGFHIGYATLEDLPAVVSLDRALALLPHWRAAHYSAAVVSNADENELIENFIGVKRCLFVARRDESIRGFAVAAISMADGRIGSELESVAVAADDRRSGMGTALCRAVVEWATSRGAKCMELEVRSQNPGPIALYSKLGFEETATRPRYYRNPEEDATRMRLKLGRRLDPQG